MTQRENPQRIIMGVDPGTSILGYGVILVDKKKVHYVDMGVIDLRKEKDHFLKLRRIFKEIGELMDKYAPDDLAIEAPFYGKNPQVMLKLGRAQGSAIAAALHRGIPVSEYAPRKVKMAITGRGDASKEQVRILMEKTLGIKMESSFMDASDALAIAMCHFYQLTNPLMDVSASSNWKSFIESHPTRVKK
ncbi:MAG TPA: crossover junction endodeoxyribonuclease RuvC [Bacteroidales bacterium]|jgi:crossover junction endodeoxyribonuclease RuvC|nr:crossover junction endodeoxyribonuclease RuvC [Bacteroidales bacterium]HQA93257.1 crossover junction endodeoxyribonuclease RuvC [Bacteroidales bacterium]